MKKILLVDDEKDLCTLVKKNLEATGDFEVTTRLDSVGVMEVVKKIKPDVVLLDILLPGKRGNEIAEELRGHPDFKDIPVIFLTGMVRGEEARQADNVIGGKYFVSKPVETSELIAIIKRACGE
ncbi:MAG: response regulator [Candidatus Omnitrophica bacterium]|nr:response regulator [Candidatus Omnitrophota bacterium]